MFQRIDHTAFEVSDISRSQDFYQQCFGFEPYFAHTTPGGTQIVYLRLGDTTLELVARPGQAISGCHFALEVQDLAAAIQHLQQCEVPLLQPPHDTPARHPREQGWRRVVFSGPDGEQIECRGPA